MGQLERLQLHRQPLPAEGPRSPDQNGGGSGRLDRFSREETAMSALDYLKGSNASSLPRRDLVAILAYLNRDHSRLKCVDGTFDRRELELNRLAAAARMQ